MTITFNTFGFVFLRFENGTIALGTSISFASEGFGFDALTGFGKDSAVTGFAVFQINFDDVVIEHLCFLIFEVKNKTTYKITVVDGFSTQLLRLFILKSPLVSNG